MADETAPQAPPPGTARPAGRSGAPGPGGHKRGKRSYVRKKKVCRFCVDRVDFIDYKKAEMRYRKDVAWAVHQRWLTVAIKRAQNIALLPFAAEL